MKIKLKDIAKICGGQLYGNAEREISSFFTDSRQASENAMFVPIVGEKVDAHNFINSVFEKNSASFSQIKIENPHGDYVLVADNRKALQDIASNYRESFFIPFVGVTGSVGKTTSKEMISLAISSEKNVLKTLGNSNSQVGLPLTLFRVDERHDCAVIEMGMSMPEEMGRISRCAKVDFAVITNIGVSHIEFHGTREKIMEEKLHIADYLNENSILFVNGDDDLLSSLKNENKYNIIEFGLSNNCDYKAIDITENENGSYFTCIRNNEKINMFVPIMGEHNVRNALVSLAVAEKLGVSTQSAVEAISKYKTPEMRQEIKKTEKLTIIDDSYNASPDSAKASLNMLSKFTGRKIAILADMRELGSYSKQGHSEVGDYAKKLDIDFLITFGIESQNTYFAFDDKNKSIHFDNFEDIEKFIISYAKKGDVILVKGSRGMKTDRFIKILEELN